VKPPFSRPQRPNKSVLNAKDKRNFKKNKSGFALRPNKLTLKSLNFRNRENLKRSKRSRESLNKSDLKSSKRWSSLSVSMKNS
jgi:hypothetical protein